MKKLIITSIFPLICSCHDIEVGNLNKRIYTVKEIKQRSGFWEYTAGANIKYANDLILCDTMKAYKMGDTLRITKK